MTTNFKNWALLISFSLLILQTSACTDASEVPAINPIESIVETTEPEIDSEITTKEKENSRTENVVKKIIEPVVENTIKEEPKEVVNTAQEVVEQTTNDEEEQRTNPTYLAWDAILQNYVTKSGIVNYEGIKSDPSFAKTVAAFEVKNPEEMSLSDAKIFWMNAYNVFTVKLIIDNLPLKSITDLGKPWDMKFIQINGKTYSLNDIEQNILRKNYDDPRIHFGINCASFSCPMLYSRAFFPGSTDAALTMLAKKFINDPKRNSISKDKIVISKIFEWYNDDFTKGSNIAGYISRYANIKISNDVKVEYMEYNWSLNNK